MGPADVGRRMIYCSSVLSGIWLPSQTPVLVAGWEEGAPHNKASPYLLWAKRAGGCRGEGATARAAAERSQDRPALAGPSLALEQPRRERIIQ